MRSVHELLSPRMAKPSVAPRAPTKREFPDVPNPLPQRFPQREPRPAEVPPATVPVRVPELVPAK